MRGVAALLLVVIAAGALARGDPQPGPAAIAERTVTVCVVCLVPPGARPGDLLLTCHEVER